MRRSYSFITLLFLILVGWLALYLLPTRIAENISLTPVAFAELDGWETDTQGNALLSFRNSCGLFLNLPSGTPNQPQEVGGVVNNWINVCTNAQAVLAEDHSAARGFFEENFTAFSMSYKGDKTGLLTGYYEPLIEGSLSQSEEYSVPLYLRPPELVTVNLGTFRADMRGQRIAGRVVSGQLRPFESRTEIEEGSLSGRNLELLWIKKPVDAFFLHIQGSGRVVFEDGSLQKVGYAGPNGHPYTSIGTSLIRQGHVSQSEMSMQKIKQWIEANPEAGKELMRENASFIFFRLLEGNSPVGSQGVELTPGRSLAVDRTLVPLGAPIWLNGTRPSTDNPNGEQVSFKRLLIAQDTGGAIRGGLRGDVFWGVGADAETIAGHMKNLSGFTILLPNEIAKTITEAE